MKHLLLWTSLGTLLLLGWAAFAENQLQEWRALQKRYRQMLPRDRRDAFSIQLRQIVVPALKASDRCVTCHLGMAPGERGVPGSDVFAPHPKVPHDPAQYGCTVCHGGQGRATSREDAHGTVAHWPEPMIPGSYAYAGCGSCHSHLAVPNLGLLERGKSLVERYDCLSCHALDGRGGTIRSAGEALAQAPDLSLAAARNRTFDWYRHHLERHQARREGGWIENFAPLMEEDRLGIDLFLDSRVGAPGLVEAKALFHTLGCRGCHKVGGVGGDDGPDLTREGQRDPGQLPRAHLPGPRSLAGWLAEHFRAPARIVPGSTMPALGLSEGEIDQLVFYMLSLRRPETPEAFWPNDRIRALRFGEREFSHDGATLYGAFCSSCHGGRGEGMRYPGMAAFPAIGNPDYLSLVTDEVLAETIRRGRPGRRMPAWGGAEGGLLATEIDSIVAHIRALGGGVAPAQDGPPRSIRGDAGLGKRLYAAYCGGCHGGDGSGAEGPALANPVFLALATDTYLFETIRQGRRGTSMEGYGTPSVTRPALSTQEIEALVAYLRALEVKP